MNKNVSTYMLSAYDFLEDARLLATAERSRSAASQVYYSYFDAVRGLLASKNISSKTHQAARSLFGQHFVKSGLFQAQDAYEFHALYNLRQNGDYDPEEDVEPSVIHEAIHKTAEFLLQTEAYLRSIGYNQ